MNSDALENRTYVRDLMVLKFPMLARALDRAVGDVLTDCADREPGEWVHGIYRESVLRAAERFDESVAAQEAMARKLADMEALGCRNARGC